MNEANVITAIREYGDTVIWATKCANFHPRREGKAIRDERDAAKHLLSLVFGRKPSASEIDAAVAG